MSHIIPIRILARPLAAALLTISLIATASARPADPGWSPLQTVSKGEPSDQLLVEGPFKGPRNSIPSLIRHQTVPSLVPQTQALRQVGPRNTVALRP